LIGFRFRGPLISLMLFCAYLSRRRTRLVVLAQRDNFHGGITEIVDMGERRLDLLSTFLRQFQGRLSKFARSREFALFTEDEIARVESIYTDLFHGGAPAADP